MRAACAVRHVFSVECVLSWGFRASHFQCMVCRVWSVWYVTFPVSDMSCVVCGVCAVIRHVSCVECVQCVTFSLYMICHICGVWGMSRLQSRIVGYAMCQVCAVCHDFSAAHSFMRRVFRVSRFQCVACRV